MREGSSLDFGGALGYWDRNIFPHDVPSGEDGGGRRCDIPTFQDAALVAQLGRAITAIIELFERWIGRSDRTVEFPLPGRDAQQTWLHIRTLILIAFGTLLERPPPRG